MTNLDPVAAWSIRDAVLCATCATQPIRWPERVPPNGRNVHWSAIRTSQLRIQRGLAGPTYLVVIPAAIHKRGGSQIDVASANDTDRDQSVLGSGSTILVGAENPIRQGLQPGPLLAQPDATDPPLWNLRWRSPRRESATGIGHDAMAPAHNVARCSCRFCAPVDESRTRLLWLIESLPATSS